MLFEIQHLFLAFLILQARILGKPQPQEGNSSKLIADFKFNTDAEDIEDWESYSYDKDYNDDYQDQDQGQYEGHRHRHLVTREAVYDSRKYVNSCNKSVRMNKNKKIRIISAFRGTKQYFPDTTCDWNFLGSSECSPKIKCPTIDIRNTDTCDEDYLLIFDGVSGGLKLCGENSDLNKAKKSKEGFDLFVIFKSGESSNFKRLFKGIECVVSCDKTGDAEPLPEKTDLFKLESECECGITEKSMAMSTRIVGGLKAKEFEFPWLVGIVHSKKRVVYCGGSLINSNYILTASHCFAVKGSTNQTIKESASEVMIHMHDQHMTDAAEKSVRVKIQRVICHPFYGHDNIEYDNDVCILQLETPVDIKRHRPICLPVFSSDWSPLHGQDVVVSGWGKLAEKNAGGSSVLQKVTVPMLTHATCERSYNDETITSRMMCAGYPDGKKDACQGDSGGPLMKEIWSTDVRIKREQIGVVSWGYGCADPGLPGMYANVAVLIPWIRRTAMSGTWCLEGNLTLQLPDPRTTLVMTNTINFGYPSSSSCC